VLGNSDLSSAPLQRAPDRPLLTKKGNKVVLARMPRWLSAHCRALFQITYPIALSELLWGTSTFVYIIVFTRIGTDALAASQIVTMIENIFIVAASGLAPAAVATVGQALGSDSLPHAQKEASLVLRAGVISGLAFAVALIGGSLLLPMIYPRVGQDVLHLAFWGIVITAFVQPAKVLNSSLETVSYRAAAIRSLFFLAM
jgi:Na+-driven multidrug efflux pump